VNSGMPNPNTKDLGIRAVLQQLFGSCQAIIGYFKSPGFNVDHLRCKRSYRYNFSMIAFFDFCAYLRFIDFVSAPRKFFFTEAGLPYCHGFDLFAVLAFSF
jgi:hypothetical protein